MGSIVGWMVCTGPDRSHVSAEKFYERRRDALQHFDGLAEAGKPCAVYRHTWKSEWSTEGTCEMVRSAHLTSSN